MKRSYPKIKLPSTFLSVNALHSLRLNSPFCSTKLHPFLFLYSPKTHLGQCTSTCRSHHIRISMVVVQHLRLSTKHVDGCISTCRFPYIHMSVTAHPHVGPPISGCQSYHMPSFLMDMSTYKEGHLYIPQGIS